MSLTPGSLWAKARQVLTPWEEILVVPTHDEEGLTGREDKRADPDFLEKGILLWTPHIHFT